MARRRKDQLGVVGLASSVLKNVAQQRSMARARAARSGDGGTPEEQAPKPKDSRTPEQIRLSTDINREKLASTVASITYSLDVPARTRDLRDRVAAALPPSWRGETKASIAAAAIAASGLAGIVGATILRVRRHR